MPEIRTSILFGYLITALALSSCTRTEEIVIEDYDEELAITDTTVATPATAETLPTEEPPPEPELVNEPISEITETIPLPVEKQKSPIKPAEKPKPSPEKPKPSPQVKIEPKITYPVKINRAFSVGENLKYKISYIGITAGHSMLGVAAGPTMNNRPTLFIRMYTESISLFWFKVRDTLESYIDQAGLFTYKYAKHLRQGPKTRDEVIDFDPVKGTAQRTKNNEKNPALKVDPFTSDVLGSLYLLRTMDLQIGKSIDIPIFDGKNSYALKVDVVKRETISVPAGKFKTIMVIPRLQSEGIFMEKGNMEVWLTDDHLKMPVLIKAKISIGSFVGKLVEYQIGAGQK